MSNLIEKIRHAQVRAGEDAVIAHLESLGLVDKTEKTTLYCLPLCAKFKSEIDKHCFGDCGKVSMAGAIDLGERIGPSWVCTEEKCPHEMKVCEVIGQSGLTGDDIRIRVLNFELPNAEVSRGAQAQAKTNDA